MELLFNELSINAPSANKFAGDEKMKIFSETVAAARKKGFRNIRSEFDSHEIEIATGYTLFNWLTSRDIPEVYRNNLFGMIILPFIEDGNEEIEKKFVEADYFFEDDENGIPKTQCLGLASAYLSETLSISLQSNKAWTKNILKIIVVDNGNPRVEEVRNIHSKECLELLDISDFVEQIGNIVLEVCPLEPDAKDIHLADHHGQAELRTLWRKLKNSPYVVSGRSTDWGGKRFIRKAEKNGIVEIVLVDTDRKYALHVQTTGRNLRETRAIAEILDEKYS